MKKGGLKECLNFLRQNLEVFLALFRYTIDATTHPLDKALVKQILMLLVKCA